MNVSIIHNTLCACRNDTGVFVSDIVKGGIADADGRLMQGDQILMVNGEDVRNANQEAVAALLKVTSKKTKRVFGCRFKLPLNFRMDPEFLFRPS